MPLPITTVAGKTITTPVTLVPGIVTGAAYTALDAMGTVFSFDVPASGVIQSANYFDLDDEGLQVDLWLLSARPTLQTDNGALTFSDGDMLSVIKVISFTTFHDAANCQSSEVDNIGRAFVLPARKMWAQVQAQGVQNIAANNIPAFSLTILADE
jgi:hypothetical protein